MQESCFNGCLTAVNSNFIIGQSVENKRLNTQTQMRHLYCSPTRLKKHHRRGEGKNWKIENSVVFWTCLGYHTHNLTVTVLTYRRSALDQDSSHYSVDGGEVSIPSLYLGTIGT